MVLRSTFGVWSQIASPFASFWGWCLGPFEGLFLRSFWGVFEVIFGCFEVIFDHFLCHFWVNFGCFWVFWWFLVCFALPVRVFLGLLSDFCVFWSFLTYFDHFWVLWQDQKRPLSHFLDPQKSHFPRRSRLQFSVNTKIQFWQKSTPSILDPPIELFIDPTSHSIFQNVKNCKIRRSPTAQNSKSQSKVALSKLCVKSEKWLFRCAHFFECFVQKVSFFDVFVHPKNPIFGLFRSFLKSPYLSSCSWRVLLGPKRSQNPHTPFSKSDLLSTRR